MFYDSEGKREKSTIKAAFQLLPVVFYHFDFLVFGSFGLAALAINGTGTYGM
jgi:hypothetical protein